MVCATLLSSGAGRPWSAGVPRPRRGVVAVAVASALAPLARGASPRPDPAGDHGRWGPWWGSRPAARRLTGAQNPRVEIPSFRDAQGDVVACSGRRAASACVVDFHHAGPRGAAVRRRRLPALWAQIDPLLDELKDQVRTDDLLVRDERDSDLFLLFLASRRQGKPAFHGRRHPQALRPPGGVPHPAGGAPHAAVLPRPPEGGRGLRLRVVDPAGERGPPAPAPDRGGAGVDRAAAQPARARPARSRCWRSSTTATSGPPSSPSWRWSPAQVMGFEGLARGPRGSELEYPSAIFGLASPLRPGGRAGARLPAAELRGLGELRRPRPPVHQHRARHRARHELPRPRRARLPGPEAVAALRDPRDHRGPGHREPQPVPRGHALLHRAGLQLRHRRPRGRLLGAGDPGHPRAPAT